MRELMLQTLPGQDVSAQPTLAHNVFEKKTKKVNRNTKKDQAVIYSLTSKPGSRTSATDSALGFRKSAQATVQKKKTEGKIRIDESPSLDKRGKKIGFQQNLMNPLSKSLKVNHKSTYSETISTTLPQSYCRSYFLLSQHRHKPLIQLINYR